MTERVTREKDIATRNAREGQERAAAQARMTRENARSTRENARAAVRQQPQDRARAQTPPIMARGHDERRAAAPRIERAAPHMTQPNAARGGGGPPMNARAQMPAPAAPRAAAPAMPQGGGAPHINAAPRAHGLVCNCAKERAHEHTGTGGASRPSLRNGFTAYFVLSPVNGSFATVIPEKLVSQEFDASTAASGPHDFAVRGQLALVLRQRRVHRISPRVRDVRTPLSSGETRGVNQ